MRDVAALDRRLEERQGLIDDVPILFRHLTIYRSGGVEISHRPHLGTRPALGGSSSSKPRKILVGGARCGVNTSAFGDTVSRSVAISHQSVDLDEQWGAPADHEADVRVHAELERGGDADHAPEEQP